MENGGFRRRLRESGRSLLPQRVALRSRIQTEQFVTIRLFLQATPARSCCSVAGAPLPLQVRPRTFSLLTGACEFRWLLKQVLRALTFWSCAACCFRFAVSL
jgi:hypothetical protein